MAYMGQATGTIRKLWDIVQGTTFNDAPGCGVFTACLVATQLVLESNFSKLAPWLIGAGACFEK